MYTVEAAWCDNLCGYHINILVAKFKCDKHNINIVVARRKKRKKNKVGINVLLNNNRYNFIDSPTHSQFHIDFANGFHDGYFPVRPLLSVLSSPSPRVSTLQLSLVENPQHASHDRWEIWAMSEIQSTVVNRLLWREAFISHKYYHTYFTPGRTIDIEMVLHLFHKESVKFPSMNRENRLLVTDELVEFEK